MPKTGQKNLLGETAYKCTYIRNGYIFTFLKM